MQEHEMITLEVVTPWVGDGLRTGEPFQAAIIRDFPVVAMDTTNQPVGQLPPDPNMFVLWVKAEQSVVNQIEADNRFFILWREDEASQVPSSNEFGQLRSYLAQNGASQQQIKQAVGDSVDGRSRSEIVDGLKNWMRTLNKA
jgi:hypothetical protein